MPRPSPAPPPCAATERRSASTVLRDVVLDDPRKVRLHSVLGRGLSATVHRAALQLPWGLERPVACKVFHMPSSEDEEMMVTALAIAARGWASVSHPNVVALHEFGLMDGARPFLLTELVVGRTLGDLLQSYRTRKARMSLDLALFLGVEIAEALAGARATRDEYGRTMGLVHGDLSARQVLLSTKGEVKVTDFGLAGANRAASSVRAIAYVSARAEAMAPEVLGGEASTAQSDVFSLGVLLWSMLVGPRFADGLSDEEILSQARRGSVHNPLFSPVLPEPLAELIQRTLDPEPGARPAHAGVVAYELRRIALAMGVGDGRMFLRAALTELSESERDASVPFDAAATRQWQASSEDGRNASTDGTDRTSGASTEAAPLPDGSDEGDAPTVARLSA